MQQVDQKAVHPEALQTLDGSEMRATLDLFLEAVLATCVDISKSEKLSNEEFMKLARSAVAMELTAADVEHLSDRARRTFSARICHASIIAKRRQLAIEDPERAAFVDGMLFDTVMAANYLAQMGEDRVQFMETVLDFRTDREARSDGGRKSAKSRTAWHAEARVLFDEYRQKHPEVTVATRIRSGMNRIRRIPGSSDRMMVKLILKWMREQRA